MVAGELKLSNKKSYLKKINMMVAGEYACKK